MACNYIQFQNGDCVLSISELSQSDMVYRYHFIPSNAYWDEEISISENVKVCYLR